MSKDSPIKYGPDGHLTNKQKLISKDLCYWAWFLGWWKQDFSWEGLAKQKIAGWDDGRTLQDYWREEEDNLIEFGGRTWTRFHLPMHDLDGETSEKYGFEEKTWKQEQWQYWRNIILKKLENASKYDDEKSDARAQLTGVCFPACFYLYATLPEDESEEGKERRTLHLKADWAQFGNGVNFMKAQFGDRTDFTEAQFGIGADFTEAQFGDYAWFTKAQFGNGANFMKAQFGNRTDFTEAQFEIGADFTEAQFGDYAWFTKAQFGIGADFTEAQFGDYAWFTKAQFGNWAYFTKAKFLGNCHFSGTPPDETKGAPQARSGLDFDGADFYEMADFSDRAFPKNTDFNNTHFLGLAKFHGSTFHQDTSFADADFAVPGKREWLWVDYCLKNLGLHTTKLVCTPDEAVAYQNAFQTLRLHMEKLRNHAQENKFSKLEMQAREQRVGSKDVPWWVRWLSRGYGLFADYGQSALRPFLWLIGFYFLATIAYTGIGGGLSFLGDALTMAFQYSLPPVSTFAAQFFAGEVDQGFINALLDHPALTRLVMVTHGVLSIALVFFLLLALKRRFQIR